METFDTQKPKMTKEIRSMIKNAPEFSSDEIPELRGFVPGKPIRGFAQFKEYINKNGRPKLENPTEAVTIRLPRDFTDKMRKTGKGWRTEIAKQVLAAMQ